MNNKKRIMTLLKEPLLHFLLIGAALFLIFGLRGNPSVVPGAAGQAGMPSAQIVVTRDTIEQLNSLFVKTWHRPPTVEELKAIIEDHIRSEIYYREAVAIGLDRDDDVLKWRLRQKMEFIYENISSLAEPTTEDLKAFMKTHGEKYVTDPQTAFRQVYVSTYKRGKSAEADARQILAQLIKGIDPDSVGDATMLEGEIRLSELWDIRKQFGDEFSRNLLDIKPGKWAGPIRSTYGLHLVYVRERSGGRLADLSEVREAVKRDWMFEKQKEIKDAAYAKLRQRYSITVEKPKAASTPLAVASGTGVKVQ